MSGKLYIVATPIGNLEDITLRTLEVLKKVDLVLAEDTRQTRILLKHYDIDIPILSYFQHSGEKRRLEILNKLIDGNDLALVTDAGTPGISDPGNELIDWLLGYLPEAEIIPIPGASAVTAALSVSGFNVNKFVFLGFLPKKKRNKLFKWLKEGKMSFAFYESPKRLLASLEILSKVFGKHRRVFVAREMTKLHETLYRGKIDDVINELSDGSTNANRSIKGEIVVVLEQY